MPRAPESQRLGLPLRSVKRNLNSITGINTTLDHCDPSKETQFLRKFQCEMIRKKRCINRLFWTNQSTKRLYSPSSRRRSLQKDFMKPMMTFTTYSSRHFIPFYSSNRNNILYQK